MKHIFSLLLGLVLLGAAASSMGVASSAAGDKSDASALCRVEANNSIIVAANQIKDCSKMTNCWNRCQCQYDNCTAACGDTDAKCVNRCIANWQNCREGC